MSKVRTFALLLVASFVGVGIPLVVGVLLGVPLIRWMIQGVLYFPVSGAELLRLAWLILGMTAVVTIVLWLEGKWKGRW